MRRTYDIVGWLPERYEYCQKSDNDLPSWPPPTWARERFDDNPASQLRVPHEGLYHPRLLNLQNLHRPIDWRWQLVCIDVHRGNRTFAGHDCVWLERGWRYLDTMLDCCDEQQRTDLACRESEVHTACAIYQGPDKVARGRLEGYLLGPWSIAEIAAKCDVSQATVEAYEQLFFDVRNRLNDARVIRKVAFDGRSFDANASSPVTANDVDLILRYAGHFKGGIALERMIQYFAADWSTLEEWIFPARVKLADLNDRLAMHVLVLLWCPPGRLERAELFDELRTELERLLGSWPEEADDPAGSPVGPTPITDEQLQTWWSSWRRVVDLARKVPEQAPRKGR